MTHKQRELARHALGLPNRKQLSYRNHFVCGPDHDDYEDWLSMCQSGLAKHRNLGQASGGDEVFWLTAEGAKLALDEGENLDVEDFS
jgi:hypothetical protein